MSWVQDLIKIVSVTRKLTWEWHKDQTCLFWQEDYGNKGHNPLKKILGLSPSEDSFFSLETRNNRKMVSRSKLLNWAETLQEQRKEPLKSALGFSPGEDMVSGGQSLSKKKSGTNICQHVSICQIVYWEEKVRTVDYMT
jgi:hypothetical protein